MNKDPKNKDRKMYCSVPLTFDRRCPGDMASRALAFYDGIKTRRSVRHFSDESIPLDAVRSCIDAAAQAPSGANKQPWTFVLVTNPDVKRRIREGAEAEEREHYAGRASQTWLGDLAALGTDAVKPFLQEAPALIVVFAQKHGRAPGQRHYYVSESVGIATGFLLAALHTAGFATLTHTPSPMGFLGEILARPDNERPYLLIPVGFPKTECSVPDIRRKERCDYLVEV